MAQWKAAPVPETDQQPVAQSATGLDFEFADSFEAVSVLGVPVPTAAFVLVGAVVVMLIVLLWASRASERRRKPGTKPVR
jgi:hypothetical protein